jgi:hypothetical protein
MARRVECEVRSAEIEFQGRTIAGVEVTCLRCEHCERAGGTTGASVRRCLALLRENCPAGEDNWYVDANEDEEDE